MHWRKAGKRKRLIAILTAAALCITSVHFASPIQAAEAKDSQTNLALNQAVYFSSEEGTSTSGADTHAVKAVDGDKATCWSANGKPNGKDWDAQYPEWLCVDLGKEYNLDKISLIFEGKNGARYYGYNVYVSGKAPESGNRAIPEGFEKIISRENNTQSTSATAPITETITDVSGRYVLVQVTSCNQLDANKWQVASIYELEVYGTEKILTPDNPDQPGIEDGAALQTASGRDSAYAQEIDGQWQFGGRGLTEANALNADRTSWSNVTIPHTWNASDAEDGGGNYVRDNYWYHKEINVTAEMLQKRVFIEFLGANTQTTVYVNGQKAGDTHKGGYTTFRYDITDKLNTGANTLDVCVDNKYTQTIAPISGDFNMYGGIYRRVYLIMVDDVHIDLEKNGSSGLMFKTGNMRSKEKPADLGKFDIQADIVNDSNASKQVTVVAAIKGDNAPAPIEKTITIPANGSQSFNETCTVSNPTLWEGIRYDKNADNSKVGYQYEVTLEIKDGDRVIDKVSDKLGFRYFWIDSKDNGESGEGFFLNGKKFPLRGVNRHSYLKSVGSAMTEEQHKNDMEIIKELGVNTIRLCHYPQTDYFYDLCDENGIIVWTEIPVVNEVRASDEFKNITKQQLTELIFQQYNRPSVCFWGLENEIGNGQSLTNATANKDLAAAKQILFELDKLAKELDTTGRYTTQALNRDYGMDKNEPDSVNKDFNTNIGWKSDIVAWNIYPGWYPDANFYGSFDDVMKRKTAGDSRSMGISEYGWGANVNQHEAYPELGVNNLTAGGSWHPEEYQNLMNEEALAYINTHDELWGTFYWVMFDFAVDGRNEGSQPALNDKGLVTADRKTKKDSFYLYKANWNKKDSFVYITSRRWTKRENSDTYIKVYSNCDEVTLSVNDQELGKMESKGNGVFLMEDVSLPHGNVEIKAVGNNRDSQETYPDTCTWQRENSNKADLTSKVFAVDTTAKTIAINNNVTLKDFRANVKGVNNAVYKIYNGDTEVTEETAVIVPGMRIHVIAENQQTEADYAVINTNLCLNKPVTVSSFETGNIAENAVDGNSATRWTAKDGTFPQILTVDLEKAYFLGDLTLDWEKKTGSRCYGYAVSVSRDGENFVEVIDRRDNTDAGSITDSLGLVSARYIRITATGCNESGWATLYEVKADGYLVTSDAYTVDEQHRLIIVDEIPNTGLADSVFGSHLTVEGNYGYKLNYSSGWIHDGNTVDILDTDNEVAATYTICTEATKENYYTDVPVTRVSLNKVSDALDVGDTLQMEAVIFPANASDTTLRYESSNPDVVSVTESGLVTAKKAGRAVITATSVNGISDTCEIVVVDYANIIPVASFSFDNASDLALKGKAALVKDPDDASNQVLLIDNTAGGKNGNYAIAANDLSGYDFSNGVTVSMRIRPTANSSDWNYLFAIGQTKSSNASKYCDGTVGFIARHDGGNSYEAHYPGDGWIEGNPVNSDYAFFTKAENANRWYRMTFVYAKSEIRIYVDGILTCKWAESKISDVLAALNQGHMIIGAGASEGELENFGGYMDDFYVYDSALNDKAVTNIGKNPQGPTEPKKEQGSLTITCEGFVYDGKAKPNPQVAETTNTGAEVIYTYYTDAACTTEIAPPDNAGTYYVKGTVKETDNYTQAVSEAVRFVIAPKKVENATVTGIVNKTYTGKALTQPGMKIAGYKEGVDYAVTYANNVKAGKATITITFKGNYTGTLKRTFQIKMQIPKKNKIYKVGKYQYRITKSAAKGGTAELKSPVKKTLTSVSIVPTVKINGYVFKVTSVGKNAFKNNKKLKKVTIGANITKIGANAFSGCKKLKNITVKTKKLKSKSVGKNAFKNIHKKAVIRVPKAKKKAYKKVFKGKGLKKTVKIK